MTRTDLVEILGNGENSGVEFKRDDVHVDRLSKEIVALLNLEGGKLLLGVEDDGTVSGLTRTKNEAEQWIINICRQNIKPPIIPFWETIQWDATKIIGVISLPTEAPDKPYKALRGSHWITFIRVGSTSREVTREEEARLYQASGLIRYDIKPLSGSKFEDLDLPRLRNYFKDIRKQESPADDDKESWIQLLLNTDLMVGDRSNPIPTVGAILLFSSNPKRFLPQAGISAVSYPDVTKDYATRERSTLIGPIVPLLGSNNEIIGNGLIDQAIDFVRRNISVEASIDTGGRMQERWRDYPLEAIRETVVNAVAHRDYSITVTDIELSIYSDRLEIISPGRLPNTVTVEKMKYGYRATRNELIKEVLRDYKYIEASGLGVPRKIIKGMMEHNGSVPDLVEDDERFRVSLFRDRQRH